MSDTRSRIEQLQLFLKSRTLLSYAPSVQRALAKELECLVRRHEIENSVEETVREELRGQLPSMLKSAVEETEERVTVEADNRGGNSPSRFIISSLLLSESFTYLCRQPEESLHLATGVTIGKTCTVETLVPVALSHASIVSAEADAKALSRVLFHLDRLGHCLTGVFHVHPGEGPETTLPSGVDRSYLQRLGGRSLVFGIWSRDGYCRILTTPADSVLHVYGDAVIDTRKEKDAVIYKVAVTRESLLRDDDGPSGGLVVGRKLVRPSGAN